MSSTSLTFRFIVILSVLTILNITFLGMSWQKKEQVYACSLDNVIDGAAKYIRQNGALSFEKALPESCRRFEDKKKAIESLNAEIRNLVDVCRKRKREKLSYGRKSVDKSIVLFTTWSNDSSKDTIHKLTLQNWVNLRPKVQIVVFTNVTKDIKLATSLGATTFPIIHHGGGGAPILKWMFLTVLEKFSSYKLFGYVNSDILFTNTLTATLESVRQTKDISKPLFLVGRRINVENVLANETYPFSNLETVAKKRGELFGPNAEDFFITNDVFPWKDIVDVVIGRVAYDNWIVGHVICKLRYDVIDLSETVVAVHQTTKHGGNYEGFKSKHVHHNNALFKKMKIIPNFDTGFTICSQELTNYNLCGDIEIIKRKTFWEKCKCPHNVTF